MDLELCTETFIRNRLESIVKLRSEMRAATGRIAKMKWVLSKKVPSGNRRLSAYWFFSRPRNHAPDFPSIDTQSGEHSPLNSMVQFCFRLQAFKLAILGLHFTISRESWMCPVLVLSPNDPAFLSSCINPASVGLLHLCYHNACLILGRCFPLRSISY